MKVWRLITPSLDALTLQDESLPSPGHGEVQVMMAAAAINYRDLGVAAGVYHAVPNLIPFSDGAGTITAVGEGVEDFAVGDKVVSCFFENWPHGPGSIPELKRSYGSEIDGMLAQARNLKATGIVHQPKSLDHAQSSTLVCAGLTAWAALFTEGNLQPGQHVVVQGTGGVAIFALQFAKMAGATVTVLSSSDEKLARAKAMGADQLVNYKSAPDWDKAVRDYTNGRGADVIVELGGRDTIPKSLAALRTYGMIAIIGLLSGIESPVPIFHIIRQRARVHGITVSHRADMQAMIRAIDAHGIKPVIERHYAFENVRQAYLDMPGGKHFGKLVVDI